MPSPAFTRGSSLALSLAGAGLDTSEGWAFVRDRLAFLGRIVFILCGGFWVSLILVDLSTGATYDSVLIRTRLFHLGAVAAMGLLWMAARLSAHPPRMLGMHDAGALLLCCWCYAGMIAASETVLIALLAGMATVTTRAVIVPSSPARTFWLSLAALAPTIVGSLLLVPDRRPGTEISSVVTAILWVAVAAACSTVASRVIYGLRRRVKEASEVGQYTLEEQIGSGGMGEVWRARHRLLIRPAAIKLINPTAPGSGSGNPELLLRRFEREARATAALQSPHTVQLYDFGVADDGRFYYVMELLSGFNLEELVERFGPLRAERVVHILTQVCDSLTDAHQNGLVHRDIKPANILVTRVATAFDFVKVLDFGLVKLERPPGSEDLGLTGSGTTSGTPAFMAPETVLGEAHADHRVDLYSLGCVAYWMLTGHLVFEGGSPMKIMLDHARTPPPPPSTRVELPIAPELERVVLDCLAKAPADRPQSAAELARRLRAIPLAEAWTEASAAAWWQAHAPGLTHPRPVADVLLSHESRPAHTART